ncbi:glycosyltransferase family 2 protein [bacterium]|nr:glycosyltransferase family 2 protein [bacterium]
MSGPARLFWLGLAFVAYTYLFYPVLIGLAAKLRPRPVRRRPNKPLMSIVIAAHNESANIERRVENLLDQDYPADQVEILIVSDGSIDDTPAQLEKLARIYPQVRTWSLPINNGKAVAINHAMERAQGEIVVFTDARQRFARDVLARLAENFSDPQVGSVSGELIFENPALSTQDSGLRTQDSATISVGLYWRYEVWLRRQESGAGSMLGATGAIYAIRRELWQPLPPGTILDDFLTPMRIVLAGRRAILDGRAVCFDKPSSRARQEMTRKVRTLAGNFQAFALEPGLLVPWRNPSTWFQLVSHKLARLLVPYALILMLFGSLAAHGWFYHLVAAGQLAFYGLAAAGHAGELQGRTHHSRLVTFAYTFATLNIAAVIGLIAWAGGKGAAVWKKS